MAYTQSDRNFRRDLQLATAALQPAAIAAELASLARNALSEVIRSGEGSPRYDRYVNGRAGADESTVIPPGPIFYVFHWWNDIIEFALETLQKRSPVKTGRYQDSFRVLVDGMIVQDFASIPIGAEVMIVNIQPYARKIEVGHMRMSVPDGVVEDSVMKVRRRFGNVAKIGMTMTTLSWGYILKGYFTRGYKQFARTKLRKDTQAGSRMTYPAMTMKLLA